MSDVLPGRFEDVVTLMASGFDRSDTRLLRRMLRLSHPDSCSDPRAADVFSRLNAPSEPAPQSTVRAGRNTYTLTGSSTRGALSDLLSTQEGPLVKVARRSSSNDLLEREARALTALAGVEHSAYFPRLLDTFRTRDPGGVRQANVLEHLDGFVPLEEVRRAYPMGIDARDAAWMWRRLLVALGSAHRQDLVHGAVLPEHVMIHPAQHGLVLLDWCYSTPVGSKVPARVPGREAFYAPEVIRAEPSSPGTDLLMAAETMCSIMGAVPRPIRLFADSCRLAPSLRPRDAWSLLADLDSVLADLWGRRRFRPFVMPTDSVA